MFSANLVLISAAVVLSTRTVLSKKCVYVRIGDGFDSHENNYVECTNVNSMNELSTDIMSDWNRMKIINDINAVFTTAENDRRLEYVQNLDLSQAGTLDVADYGFRSFTQLIQLNVSSTRISTLNNSWFSRSNNIQTLDLSWNKLTSIKLDDLRTLSKLLVANFSHNEIEVIETLAFSTLRRMQILNLRNNRIADWFDVGDLPSLEVLNLDGNFLVQLPSNGFSKLRGLQTLTLSQNSLSTLQRYCFRGLETLTKLNISGNRITNINDYLFDEFSTIRLQELDFSDNDISIIESNAFQELNVLQIFNLSGNCIRDLLETTFRGLNSLRKLYLINNHISDIEARTFASLQNLDELDLSGNYLQSFSGDVFGNTAPTSSPRKLRKLFLKRNNLLTIRPHSFNQIANLDYLSLAFNSIVRFDENLFLPLTKLKKLHINHNKLEELTASMFHSIGQQLQELYIDHNKLTFFPDISTDFGSLVKVSVEGNPWQCPCLNDILSWLKQRGVEYRRSADNPYYNGLKPICVTSSHDCIRDIDAVKVFRVVEKYANACISAVPVGCPGDATSQNGLANIAAGSNVKGHLVQSGLLNVPYNGNDFDISVIYIACVKTIEDLYGTTFPCNENLESRKYDFEIDIRIEFLL